MYTEVNKEVKASALFHDYIIDLYTGVHNESRDCQLDFSFHKDCLYVLNSLVVFGLKLK